MTRPLLPFPPGCAVAELVRRDRRFIIECLLNGRPVLAHTNNSGSMLGLVRPGTALLLSPAAAPGRKLPYTLEAIVLPGSRPGATARMPSESPTGVGGPAAIPDGPADEAGAETPPGQRDSAGVTGGPAAAGFSPCVSPDATTPSLADGTAKRDALPPGLAVGVNTMTPNRLLRAAFFAGRLAWAEGYTDFKAEAARGPCRFDALLTGPGLPPLWVECKNVTLVEDGVATFPDAVTVRGQKHLREMTDITRSGERAAFFYCVQRADAFCFGPADYIDPAYAALYYRSLDAGVEARPHIAPVTMEGVNLGPALPLAPRP